MELIYFWSIELPSFDTTSLSEKGFLYSNGFVFPSRLSSNIQPKFDPLFRVSLSSEELLWKR
ncbi:hypothetical protein LEP1GSC060_2392 [Leptospira weilii serovar Ranarum str. ICFT]|uniref:Uncharacterized protein n=1 Tax=Leptospira weilii serovar Ranarum str. ICFT TaxID=1218598 RepID=N1WKG7_9LEPT|nr:hypothetical protein LEP1GSC060_2392 [Leptospira weilii serovar Ranarum str. ICFT]